MTEEIKKKSEEYAESPIDVATRLILRNAEGVNCYKLGRCDGFVEGVKYGLKQHSHDYLVKTKKLKDENNRLLDVINNQDVKIADLEKKVKHYEQQLSAMEKGVCDVCKVKDADYYEKQIADLKEDLKLAEHNLKVKQGFNDNQYVYGLKISNQLEQAIEIIKSLIDPLVVDGAEAYDYAMQLKEQAEQFIKENE